MAFYHNRFMVDTNVVVFFVFRIFESSSHKHTQYRNNAITLWKLCAGIKKKNKNKEKKKNKERKTDIPTDK